MELAVRQLPVAVDNLGDWLAGQLSGQTQRAYRSDIQQFIDWAGSSDLRCIVRQDIFRYRAILVEKYAPATVNRKLSSLRQLFTEAVRHGIRPDNPAEGLKGHKVDGVSKTLAPGLDQAHQLCSFPGDSIIDIRDRAILSLMCGMGLRREEVIDLRPESIVNYGGEVCLEIVGKGRKFRRNAVPGPVLDAVRQWMNVVNLKVNTPLFQPIVNSEPTGKALSVSAIYKLVLKRFKQVGIEGCSPHSLRHYNITDLLAQGASIYEVQQWAGHSDPKTTERYNRAQDNIHNSIARLTRI